MLRFTPVLSAVEGMNPFNGNLQEDCTWYLPQNAWTTLCGGKLTIQSGSLTVDKLVIK